MKHVKSKFEYVTSGSVYALLLVAVLGVGLGIGLSARAIAATEAGTIIKNQASASYKDTQGVRRVVTSNIVETVIRQVAAIELSTSQTKSSAAGQQIYFTHTLTNTGNGPDTIALTANASGVGAISFDPSDIKIYEDDDRDGEPDSLTSISQSHLLGAGESQSFVVSVVVPAGALNGDQGGVNIQAQSAFDASFVASNTDTAIATDYAVIAISKQISALQGSSPGGPFTVSIYYTNSTDQSATDVALIDALPAGMSYVAGSGRWSQSSSTVLTDANASDSQNGIIYCAYETDCTGLPEAYADSDSLSTNQVTAIIASVGAGQSGYIEFQVAIDSDQPSSTVINTAEVQYTAGGGLVGPVNSNSVPFEILRGAAVVINGSNVSSVDGTGEPLEISDTVAGTNSNYPECLLTDSDPDGDGYGLESGVECVVPTVQAGNAVFYKNTVWNMGNSIDIFDITTASSSFPTDTLFRLLQADGQTPLVDTSNNGIVDTGPIAPGGSYDIVLQVVLPVGVTGDNAGANFDVSTVATSVDDAVATNSMVNTLLNISGGSIDITNIAELGNAQAVGAGAGPEAAAVTSVSIAPGATDVVELYINNTSEMPMDYDLSASIHSDFSIVELPDGWQLEFTLPDNTVLSNTGVIAAGSFLMVQAKITVPADLLPTTVSIYFKAHNDAYAVSDIKHDEIVVGAQESVILSVNQNGQTQAGGSHVYSHYLQNSGNITVTNIALTLTDSRASEGWNSLVYEDTDSNGSLSSADKLVSTTDLTPGELKTLFVKVFAPGTAGDGESNFSELTAAWSTGLLSITDVTTISLGEISMIKEQAQDVGCDGLLDSAYSRETFSVEPGNNCVSYRLTAVNDSAQVVNNVVVADATPNFTSYIGSASCSQAGCTIVEPPVGGEGEVKASLPQLLAGDSMVVEFLVRID